MFNGPFKRTLAGHLVHRTTARSSSSSASSEPSPSSRAAPVQRQFHPHLNYRHLRDAAPAVNANIRRRSPASHDAASLPDAAKVAALYELFVKTDFEASEGRRRRNEIAARIALISKGTVKNKGDVDSERQSLVEEGRLLKARLAVLEAEVAALQDTLYEEARHIPNDTHPAVPVGDESAAALAEPIINRHLQFTAQTHNFPLRDHVSLATALDMVDFDRAGKVSGSGFYYLKNAGALLEIALVRYAVDICLKHRFTLMTVPDLIRHEVLEACGFAPRSDDPQTYFVSTSSSAATDVIGSRRSPLSLCLSATAEFPLAALHANEILMRSSLPRRNVAIGRAFRAEGLAGALNRGLYRVHQFTKVEMFALCDPSDGASWSMFEEFRQVQREIFTGLEICLRCLDMPTEDLGAPAARKYDFEAWMPGRGAWGEVSSTSNCTDYQSRRLNIRCSGGNSNSPDFVHTVNGTAAAIPRLIIALLETHQLENGDIMIPKALRPYMWGEGVDRISANQR